jgi:hypothetical protein
MLDSTTPLTTQPLTTYHCFMRRYTVLLFALFALLAAPSCSPKSGCEATESLKPKTNKKGGFVKSKSKAEPGLFPKKMQKKMKK